ncbi:MAG: hypothetical protein CTY31_02900 [Hyphomicrobium sp.]|nr:MAG: hypothetical protein CTY31_02900 [Hyphomicrobium sp.]
MAGNDQVPERQAGRTAPCSSSAAGLSLEALMRSAATDGSSAVRPVDTWNPPYCGDIGLKIRADGSWLYRDSPIGRIAIVKLFASILRKDADGKTFLVTPAEKVDVAVEDAPFLAVEMAVSGEGQSQNLSFRTNVDDVVTVGPTNPIRFEVQNFSGGLKPYLLVRGRLEALCTRAVYAELVGLAQSHDDGDTLGIWSGGTFWPMS